MKDLLLRRLDTYRTNVHDLLLNFIGDSQFAFDESRPHFRCRLKQIFARETPQNNLARNRSQHALPDIDQCRLVLRDQLGEVHLQYVFQRLEERNGEDRRDSRRAYGFLLHVQLGPDPLCRVDNQAFIRLNAGCWTFQAAVPRCS